MTTLVSLYKTRPLASDRLVDVERSLSRLEGASPGTGERPELMLGKF